MSRGKGGSRGRGSSKGRGSSRGQGSCTCNTDVTLSPITAPL